MWEVCNRQNEGTPPSSGIFASIAFAKSFLVTPSGYFVEGVLPFFEAGNKMWQRDSTRLVIISSRLAFMVILFIRRRSRACWRDLGLTLGYWEDTRHATGVLRPHTLFGWRLKIIPNLVQELKMPDYQESLWSQIQCQALWAGCDGLGWLRLSGTGVLMPAINFPFGGLRQKTWAQAI